MAVPIRFKTSACKRGGGHRLAYNTAETCAGLGSGLPRCPGEMLGSHPSEVIRIPCEPEDVSGDVPVHMGAGKVV